MPLISRLGRLFRADMNAVLDRIEEPELLLRQSIREMDEQVRLSAQREQSLSVERERIATRQERLANAVASISEELDLCFAADNEVLARSLLRRRLEAEQLAQQLQRDRQRLDDELRSLGATLADQNRRLDSMRQKAALFDSAASPAATQSDDSGSWRVSDDDVELALLRERRARAAS